MPAGKKGAELKKLGLCEENYHRLFVARLNREGRGDAFYKRRSELYHSDEYTGRWDATWHPVAREFGFISKADEIERYEQFMLVGTRTKMEEQRDQLKADIEEERMVDELSKIPIHENLDLPADISWVYSHPAMLRTEGRDGTVKLEMRDFTTAPNPGAAGMLRFFVNNKRDFYRMVLTHLSKKDTAGADEKGFDDDLRDVSEIQSMLDQIE